VREAVALARRLGACLLGQGRVGADGWSATIARAARATAMWALATVSGFEFSEPVNFI
jgi:hypothetical protein